MLNLFGRIPAPVVGGLLVALLALTFFVRSQAGSGHNVPLGLALVRWVKFIAFAVLGLFQLARACSPPTGRRSTPSRSGPGRCSSSSPAVSSRSRSSGSSTTSRNEPMAV